MSNAGNERTPVSGEFIHIDGERYYAICNVDRMAPFFISVVSDSDHWMFVSSTGGLTAGRVSPETALFPYTTVDRIYESNLHTGSKTLLRVERDGQRYNWEPFNQEHDGRYELTRNLYKNLLGNKLCFEEINHDLGLTFRYCWKNSDSFGFVRDCQLSNHGDASVQVEMIDGLQNVLPAGAPRHTQAVSSNLVDAYKYTELSASTGLAVYTLYSAITDRAEPCESLRANTIFCLGLENHKILLSNEQIGAFRRGAELRQEPVKRGIRGAYLVAVNFSLSAAEQKQWQLVADLEKSQVQVAALEQSLVDHQAVASAIAEDVVKGSDELARIMAAGDGFQQTGEEAVSAHHYANVLFNLMRGGTFNDQYRVPSVDFAHTVAHFNKAVFDRHQKFLQSLPEVLEFPQLLEKVREQNDPQLERLASEYLPITFGRRHGDPSRPWNQFAIKLKDEHGYRLLSYQGNWRDIFQNWEALAYSYPELLENMIAKFVNASTIDGYNPYRITKEGIDWEVEEPDDPWSYIGYWGDHQIIYLLKLLELSEQFHPQRLGELLHKPIFCYANVPYRIKDFPELLKNAKDTVTYDDDLSERIEQRVFSMGADGKMVLAADGAVYQVNLLEKLLVPLLAKLGNLVIGGGIWLNTQRPEWNDANNALVGQGLSMVTLYYIRRYIDFVQKLLAVDSSDARLSVEVAQWLAQISQALRGARPLLDAGDINDQQRFDLLRELGEAAATYRKTVYAAEGFSGSTVVTVNTLNELLDDAQAAIDFTIQVNRRDDGLYHAYNLLGIEENAVGVDHLYPMLEGQVSALSAGALAPEVAADVLEKLFDSDIYRDDQKTFMLYPDRAQTRFMQRNSLPEASVKNIPLLATMLGESDQRLIARDSAGNYRFNPALTNAGALNARLDSLHSNYGEAVDRDRAALLALYEQVFDHKSFTGRSGGMFGFEGLGCIYWHMVSKLLLAVEENFFHAREQGADAALQQRLAELYYRVREGIGFNKTPEEYGAFPVDPYSHTPKHAGAQQPGMTGQVKEEVLTRFAELGVRVKQGLASFDPALLRRCEFNAQPSSFRYLDIDNQWQQLALPANALAFTWCQVPVLYRLDDGAEPSIEITCDDGHQVFAPNLGLTAAQSAAIFKRNGEIRQISLTLNNSQLFKG